MEGTLRSREEDDRCCLQRGISRTQANPQTITRQSSDHPLTLASSRVSNDEIGERSYFAAAAAAGIAPAAITCPGGSPGGGGGADIPKSKAQDTEGVSAIRVQDDLILNHRDGSGEIHTADLTGLPSPWQLIRHRGSTMATLLRVLALAALVAPGAVLHPLISSQSMGGMGCVNAHRPPAGSPAFALPPLVLDPHHPLCAATQRSGGQRWVTGSGRTRAIACRSVFMAAARQPGEPAKDLPPEKVLSPITGRTIRVNGQAFQKVLELGYIFFDGQLLHKNFVGASKGGPANGARPQGQDTRKQAARRQAPGQRSTGATVARSAGARPSSRAGRCCLWPWRAGSRVKFGAAFQQPHAEKCACCNWRCV